MINLTAHYSDPKHPRCASLIEDKRSDLDEYGSIQVLGADAAAGEGHQCQGKSDVLWGPLPGNTWWADDEQKVEVDFSAKGGPANLSGSWDVEKEAIVWADGNEWPRLPELY